MRCAWRVIAILTTFVVAAACTSPSVPPQEASPSRSEPSSSPSPSPARTLSRDISPTLDRFRSRLQTYLEQYSAYVASAPSANDTPRTFLKRIRRTQRHLLRQLDRLAAIHEDVSVQVNAAIELGTIPEAEMGQVSEADVRRYVRLLGNWIDNARRGYQRTAPCLRKALDETIACLTAFSHSDVLRRGASIARELNRLRTKLFGGSA